MKIKALTTAHNYFKNLKMLNKKIKFACYADQMFIYDITVSNGNYYEFTVICEDTLLLNITIKEFLNLQKIEYFDINCYEKIGEKVACISRWSSMDESQLN